MLFEFGQTNKSVLYLILFTYSLFVEGSAIADIQSDNYVFVFVIVEFGNITKLGAGLIELLIIKKYIPQKRRSILDNTPIVPIKLVILYLCMCLLEYSTQIAFVSQKQLMQTMSTPLYLDVMFKGLQIFFAFSLASHFLKYKFERYKKFGLAIMGIGLTICCVVSLTKINSSLFSEKTFWVTIGLHIWMNFAAAVHEVIEKYLLHFRFQSVYRVLFFQGIFHFVINITFIIIIQSTGNNDINFWGWISSHIKILMAYLVTCSAYNFFRILINNTLTPTHRIVADSFSALAFFLLSLYYDFSFANIIICCGYLISSFGSIIYNEMIIIKVWELNKDTVSEIDKRGAKELRESEAFLSTFKKQELAEEHYNNVHSTFK